MPMQHGFAREFFRVRIVKIHRLQKCCKDTGRALTLLEHRINVFVRRRAGILAWVCGPLPICSPCCSQDLS